MAKLNRQSTTTTESSSGLTDLGYSHSLGRKVDLMSNLSLTHI